MPELDDRARFVGLDAQIDELLAVVSALTGGPVTLDTPLVDLGFDSLGLLELVVATEHIVGPVADDALEGAATIADLVAQADGQVDLGDHALTEGGVDGGVERPAGVQPLLTSRRVALRPVEPADRVTLYRLALSASVGYRFRYRGATPTFEQFEQNLGEGTLVQFVVEQRSTGEIIGLVSAFGASLRDQHAHLAFFFGEQHQRQGWPLEALALFLDYVFTVFDLAKLYGQLSELNLPLLASGLDDLFVEEARLVEHDFYDGRHWDSLILAIYRDRWLCADNALRSRIHTNSGRQRDA